MVDCSLLTMFTVQLLANSVYSAIAPFYPKIAIEEKGANSFMVGVIFSGYPIAAALSSPILGLLITRIGRKTAFVAGAFICATAGLLFAFLPSLDSTAFVACSMLLRLFQGLGGSAINTASFAIIASGYKDNMETILGIQQVMGSLGMMVGPLLGGALFALNGFRFMFIVYSCVFFLFLPLACLVIPKDKPYVKPELEVKLQDIVTNIGVLLVAVVVFMSMVNVSFLEPILAQHLETYGLSAEVGATFFALPTVSYALTTPFVSRLQRAFSRKHVLALGLLVSAVSFGMMGPSEPIPRHLAWVISGLVVLGPGLCFMILPSLPEMVRIAQHKMPQYEPEHVSDAVSGVTTFSFFIGEIAGPPLGGFLQDHMNFASAATVTGLINLGYMVVFFVSFTAFLKAHKIQAESATPLLAADSKPKLAEEGIVLADLPTSS